MDRRSTLHAVDDVRLAPGELSFTSTIGDRAPQRVWMRTDAPVTPSADAILALTLLPTMRTGGSLRLPAPLSPRLLRTQREYQAIQQLWSREWSFGIPPLREVEVEAPARTQGPPTAGRGVAAFFSGGADSWSTALEHPDATDLIFVRGMDLLPDRAELADEVEARLRGAATELGRTLHVVETNVRELSEPAVPWLTFYGCALAAVALMLSPLFERVVVTGAADYAVVPNYGSNPLVDHLWSTEELEIAHDGGRFSRDERLQRIADHPVVQRTLRVCWENRDGAYNCGRCRKCLMTMATLEALGVRHRFSTFPPEMDLDVLGEVELDNEVLLTMGQDVLDLVHARGRSDLEPSVATVVARGKETLGLPRSYRRRSTPSLAPTAPTNGPAGDSNRETPDAEAERHLREAEGQASLLAMKLDSVLRSRSWRLTRPLRAAGQLLRSAGIGGRGGRR